MLAGVRSCFLFFFLLALIAAVALPVQAQVINGAPPSVTSLGFGGRSVNGVSPSVTSLGASGFGNNWSFLGNCCANIFFQSNPNPPLFSRRHHRRQKDPSPLVGVIEPVYVPYATADAAENDDDDADSSVASAPQKPAPSSKRAEDRNWAGKDAIAASPDSDAPTDPVVTQPSTVLVFKDGHQSDVLNYAIVGDTLFDFADGRTHKIQLADLDLPATHKANDDRGVDFQIPANKAQ